MTHTYRDTDRERERRLIKKKIKKNHKLQILTKNCSNPVTSSFWDIRDNTGDKKKPHNTTEIRSQDYKPVREC